MSGFPEDVLKAAREAVLCDVDAQWAASAAAPGEVDNWPSVKAAARAIMAERERIAGWHEAEAAALRVKYEKASREGMSYAMGATLSRAEMHERDAAAIRKGA